MENTWQNTWGDRTDPGDGSAGELAGELAGAVAGGVVGVVDGDGGQEVRLGRELRGRELRWFLTVKLVEAARPMRVRDLVTALQAAGFTVAGRASKVISDCLRWEGRRRRIFRLGRGPSHDRRRRRMAEANRQGRRRQRHLHTQNLIDPEIAAMWMPATRPPTGEPKPT